MTKLCVTKFCVRKLCVTRGSGGGGTARGVQIQKQESHTILWGKNLDVQYLSQPPHCNPCKSPATITAPHLKDVCGTVIPITKNVNQVDRLSLEQKNAFPSISLCTSYFKSSRLTVSQPKSHTVRGPATITLPNPWKNNLCCL